MEKIQDKFEIICFTIVSGIFCYYLFSSILQYIYILFPAYELYYDGGRYFGDTRLASVINLVVIFIMFCFCYSSLFNKYSKKRIDEKEMINNNICYFCF